jgi:hypothetical protein
VRAVPTLSIVHTANALFACFLADETLKSFSSPISQRLAMLELVLNRPVLHPNFSAPLPMEIKTGIAFAPESYRRATDR